MTILHLPSPGSYFTRLPRVCQDSLLIQGRAFSRSSFSARRTPSTYPSGYASGSLSPPALLEAILTILRVNPVR